MTSTQTPRTVEDLLSAMVAFPSITGQEAEIASYVAAVGGAVGLDVRRYDDNVLFKLGQDGPTLFLNSHLDVVPPSSDHPYPPFTPTVVDGELYGRGAVDAKASGAAMLWALITLVQTGWKPSSGQVMLGLTYGEEGGPRNGMHDLRPHLPSIDGAIVGEPTEMQPCVAQKGVLILRGVARGKTAHAARHTQGKNAISMAMRDVERLHTMTFDRHDPYLGSPTVNVTVIEGGTAHNVIPDRCTFMIDCRTVPVYDHDELIEQLSHVMESSLEVVSKRLIPAATPPGARILEAACRARPDAVPFGSPTASDWVFLADVPTIKMGPGLSQRSHTAHERMSIAALREATEQYQRTIKAFFDHG